jgi:hypothetical protein
MADQNVQIVNREDSRRLALGLIGMKVTETFYEENQLVIEFDRILRLQFSPEGLYFCKRNDVPEEKFPEELRRTS